MNSDFLLIKPPLKWAGGKRWFVNRYRDALLKVPCRRIVEPFAGGLAVSFDIAVKRNLPVFAGDINPHLINFYQQLQKKSFEPIMLKSDRDFYHQIRSEFNELIQKEKDQSFEGAQLFWALNRLGFNGLCRFNHQGFFNTPFGKGYRDGFQLAWGDYHQLFQKWQFENISYENIGVLENDFIFCDPPYDQGWQAYYQPMFSFKDQENLAVWAAQFLNPVILMNHATDRIVNLYRKIGFDLYFVDAPRRISGKSDYRKNTKEVIAVRNLSWQDLIR